MKKNGFTLVELLAVIAILAILVIIAMPNVLEMFNKAKQDAFETEVRTHVKAVTNEFIMTGQLVYSNVASGAAKLPMDGEKLDYYIELDTKGNIKVLNVTNGEFKIEATGSSQNPVTVEQIGETYKSQTAESGQEFAMNGDGTITGDSTPNNNNNNNQQNNPPVQKYYISGQYLFNATVNGTSPSIMEEVNFKSNGTNYNKITIASDLNYYTSSNNFVLVGQPDIGGMYMDSNYKMLDFGSTNQEVSKEFLDWINANATKQVYEKTVSGVWKFKASISTGVGYGDPDIVQYINFTAKGNTYNRMVRKFPNETMGQLHYNNTFIYGNAPGADEWSETDRIVDFGSTPQGMTNEFYTWFTANATKQ